MSDKNKKSYYLDYYTFWCHLLYIYSFFSNNISTKLAARLTICISSFFGSLIIIGRGKETILEIKKNSKLFS